MYSSHSLSFHFWHFSKKPTFLCNYSSKIISVKWYKKFTSRSFRKQAKKFSSSLAWRVNCVDIDHSDFLLCKFKNQGFTKISSNFGKSCIFKRSLGMFACFLNFRDEKIEKRNIVKILLCRFKNQGFT